MASDTNSDSDFHSAPSTPPSESNYLAEFSDLDDDEGEQDSVFQNVVNDLIADLSSENDDKEQVEDPVPLPDQPLSQNSSISMSSVHSTPDFMPVSTQRVTAKEEEKACKLFVPVAQQSTSSGHGDCGQDAAANDPPVVECQQALMESEEPMDQLYLDQCCDWFKRETRSTGTKNLCTGIEGQKRKKFKSNPTD